MIPPTQNAQQVLQMQQMMNRPKPEDPLMKALSHQAMAGDLMKQLAEHKMKLLKIKQKYMGGDPPQGIPPPQGAY